MVQNRFIFGSAIGQIARKGRENREVGSISEDYDRWLMNVEFESKQIFS
jgi:hypothetical protein